MSEVKSYKRVLLKLSGEALAPQDGDGILDFDFLNVISGKIKKCVEAGKQIAIVIGAGNIWRGRYGKNLDRVHADYMGMLGTVINCMALRDVLANNGVDAVVMTSVEMKQFAEVFVRDRALEYLDKGRVVIFGGGLGLPYFSTDSTVAVRAAEIKADAVLMAKNVDGVYDSDPGKNPDAKKYDSVAYSEILAKDLKVIDLTATAFLKDNGIPTLIFGLSDPENIVRAVNGEKIGTIVN